MPANHNLTSKMRTYLEGKIARKVKKDWTNRVVVWEATSSQHRHKAAGTNKNNGNNNKGSSSVSLTDTEFAYIDGRLSHREFMLSRTPRQLISILKRANAC